MPFCAFSDNYFMFDVTPVENLFVREYLTRAPGDYVRVYLYGLMLCYHPSGDDSVERIARALGMEPDGVTNAFRYWEREGAVVRVGDKPPTYQYINLKAAMLSGSSADDTMYKYRNFNNQLQALFGSERLLHAQETSKAMEWVEELKLPEAVVLRLIKSKTDKKQYQFRFATLEKTALQWAEMGIDSVEAAEELLTREGKIYQTAEKVVRQFGLRRAPTKDEIAFTQKWLEEWNQTPESIISACRETVNASNPSFGYLDRVLSSHRDVKTAAEMDGRLSAERDMRDAVKEVNRALGATQTAPTAAQIATYRRYLDAGFDHAGIVMLSERLSARGQHGMDDLDRALIKCVELNIFTRDEIDKYLSQQKQSRAQAAQIIAACGLDRAPTAGDAAVVEEWLRHSDMTMALYAAERAVGTQQPMRYADKLMKVWREAGIRDVEAARREQGAKKSAAATPQNQPPRPALQYDQRTYQDGELDYLFTDLDAAREGDAK